MNALIPTQMLSHGTLSCLNLGSSRRFYTEVLGLDCIDVVPGRVMMARKGAYWPIVCLVRTGQQKLSFQNHWGLDVATREEVDAAHATCERVKNDYGIAKISRPRDLHGDYSFYLEDLDANWWEVQCMGARTFDDIFAERGQVPSPAQPDQES